MDQLKWSKAARGIIISPIIIIFFIIINSSCIFILIIIIMARSWALVARKQVRTELDEVSLTVLHQLRWWAREMRLPRALCSFKSPAWCLQQRGRDTNMDKKKKKTSCGGAWLEPPQLSQLGWEMLMRVQLVFTQTDHPPSPPPPLLLFQYYFTISFTHENQKALELRTEDVKDCDEWVAAISHARWARRARRITSLDGRWRNQVMFLCVSNICALQLQKLGQRARESHAEVPSSASDCGDGENCC